MIGENIRQIRIEKGLKQSDLAAKAGVSRVAIGNYERGDRQPPFDIAAKIAAALEVSVDALLDQPEPADYFWAVGLDDKLKLIGCSTSFDEDNAMLWINYPDGTLEVSENDLKELNDSTDEYLRFKLYELKKNRVADFRPKRGGAK